MSNYLLGSQEEEDSQDQEKQHKHLKPGRAVRLACSKTGEEAMQTGVRE